jgi:hypothetical protein
MLPASDLPSLPPSTIIGSDHQTEMSAKERLLAYLSMQGYAQRFYEHLTRFWPTSSEIGIAVRDSNK